MINPQSVVVKSAERNHPVPDKEVGDVVQMIVREHGAEDDWQAQAVQSFNAEHGNHVLLTFDGLLRELDPQRAVVLI